MHDLPDKYLLKISKSDLHFPLMPEKLLIFSPSLVSTLFLLSLLNILTVEHNMAGVVEVKQKLNMRYLFL